jgi:N-acetylmuramoyl-L-alanine amidase
MASSLTPSPIPAPIAIQRRVIVLDPAHGGSDSGAQISDTTVEKDVTLALAFRLRAMLTARGFTVVMTRDSDSPASPAPGGGSLSLNDRAGVANHAHAAACLVLHASSSGDGVHLYRADLDAASAEPSVPPWLTAQAAWIPQSRLLQREIAGALMRSSIPLVVGAVSVRPMDSLTCPALIVELAPADEDADSINRTDYQQQVARAIAGALLVWEGQVQAPPQRSGASVTQATLARHSGRTAVQP